MKRYIPIILVLLLLCGCGPKAPQCQIVATTLPIYEFTSALCEGTPLRVSRLITEEISCVHDYTLKVDQLQQLENAQLVIANGLGLEGFLSDALTHSQDTLTIFGDAEADHEKGHHHDHGDQDPHLWLAPHTAKQMCETICTGLEAHYPDHKAVFRENLEILRKRIDQLETYAEEQLSTLQCRELITFHDGFQSMADAFDLTVLCAIEEESGSEASAAQLKALITMVRDHDLPAVFTEKNGSSSAARIISRETGIPVCPLDMALSGDSWFDAMYHNIDTLKEALG